MERDERKSAREASHSKKFSNDHFDLMNLFALRLLSPTSIRNRAEANERIIENVILTLTEGFFHIHVGRVWFSYETCAAILSPCFIVEVAFFVLPPEIDSHTTRIVDALVYAIKIEVYDFGTVDCV